jgi:predicted transposase/invertase (TIGR01784 family)
MALIFFWRNRLLAGFRPPSCGRQDTKLNRLLDYMNDTASYPEAGKEGLVKEIDDAVRMARTDEQFRSFYMLLEEKLMRERKSGYEEGEARGIAKGEARGIAKGEAKGKAEAAMLIASKMLLAGMSITDIAALTGLDEAEVKKLSKIQ